MIKHRFSVTASTAGGATAYTDTPVSGHVSSIRYVFSTSTKMASTGTVAFVGAETGTPIFSRVLSTGNWHVHPSIGAVNTTNGTVTNGHYPIPIVRERIKLTVATVGASAQGVFDVIVDGGNN